MGSTIVLADDEEDLRAVYGATLREAGYRVWEAADGAETISAVRERRPDLLLLDVWMPILNGFEVVEAMRHDALAASVKVVMLSNLDDADSRLEGFSAGVADYWVKGLSLFELRQKVGRILGEVRDGLEV
ncbi:MAG: response regulator, partial [Singulisphaera sp.]